MVGGRWWWTCLEVVRESGEARDLGFVLGIRDLKVAVDVSWWLAGGGNLEVMVDGGGSRPWVVETRLASRV